MFIDKMISRQKQIWTCAMWLIIGGVIVHNCGISTSFALTSMAHCTDAVNQFGLNNKNTSRTNYHLVAEQPFTTHIDQCQNLRLSFQTHSMSPLAITFTSGWPKKAQFFHNETVNLTKFVSNITSRTFSIICAPIGKYEIFLRQMENRQVTVIYSLKQPDESILRRFYQQTNIRFENRLQKRQLLLQWNKSKLDIHAMAYCVSINTKKNFNHFCEALQEISKKSLIFRTQFQTADRVTRIDSCSGARFVCVGQRNEHIFEGLKPNRKYHIDVFAIHMKISGLMFKMGEKSIRFMQTNPIVLSDNQMTRGKISQFEQRALFSFHNNRNHMKIQLLIIPCDYAFNASIFNQKKQIMHSQIDRPTYFQLNNKSVDLSNLLLRMSCINKDDTEKNVRFRIIVTSETRFASIPLIPVETTVEELKSLRTCSSATIRWHASADERNLKYCIVVTKTRAKDDDHLFRLTNSCDPDKSLNAKANTIKDCFSLSQNNFRDGMIRYKIKDLTPTQSYNVQVIIRLGSEIFSYKILYLSENKSLKCREQITRTKNQLPNVMGREKLKSSKYILRNPNQKIENNLIFTHDNNHTFSYL